MPSQQSFKDLKVTFKPHPVTGDLMVTKDDAAIKQAVVNLIMTEPGERPFEPNLGSSISGLLFETLDYATAASVDNEIRRTLDRYEPRIIVEGLDVEPSFEDNAFNVHLSFRIIGRQDSPPVDVNFLLQRTQ